MPRRIVYGVGLWVFLAAAALTIASMSLPNWISFTSPAVASEDPIHISYGLHVRCSSLTGDCSPFPQDSDCRGSDRYFCSMWRTVGFLMSFTVIFELACFVCFMVVLLGGRDKREAGWKMVAGLLSVVVVTQAVAMSLVAWLNDHDKRFAIGWKLDSSTILCTVSWVLLAIDVTGVVAAAFFLPPEDDYEEIPDRDY